MKPTIMIAADKFFIRNLLRTILEMEGYAVVAEAADGAEAVAMFQEHRPAIIIMDVKMPHKSGIEAAGEILAMDREARIIFCCSPGEDALVQFGSSAGTIGFIHKPFSDEEVMEIIRS